MNRPMRKLIAFSAAAAMLANVPLMGASARYVAEQVTDKEFDTIIQYPDRNLYIENGTAEGFSPDQQLVVVGTDGTTRLITLDEGIKGGVSYASTTMGLYDFYIPTSAEYGFNFLDPSHRFSLLNGFMIVDAGDKMVLTDADGNEVASYSVIRYVNGEFFEVITDDGRLGIIDSSGKEIIKPSAGVNCIYLSADRKYFFIDGDGKDYFTDLTGKRISPEYSHTSFLVSGRYSLTWAEDLLLEDAGDLVLENNYFLTVEDGKRAFIGGNKFEVITDYYDYIDVQFNYDSDDISFSCSSSLYDENENKTKYKYTYFDQALNIVDQNEDSPYDPNYSSITLSYSDGETEKHQRYLLHKKSEGSSEYDQLLDTKMNVLLEGERLNSLYYGICVEKDGKFTLYNGKLEKLGVFNNKIERASGLGRSVIYLGVLDDKTVVFNQYMEMIIDNAPASATNVTVLSHFDDNDYYDRAVAGYVVSGEDFVQVYDTEYKLISTKKKTEEQKYFINDKNDIFIYNGEYTVKQAGDNFYLEKENAETAKIVDINGKTIVEVPVSLSILPNGCFFENKDDVLTFYDKTGKKIRQFNTSYNFKEMSRGDYRNTAATADLSNIIMNDKDEKTGKLTTTVYDLNTDTVKFTQTGKYDNVEALYGGFFKTSIYPEKDDASSENGLWTDDSGFKSGLLKNDGTELIAPSSGMSISTSQYCFSGYSRPDYRDFAIDAIYNDSKPNQWYDDDPFYVTSEEGSGVDCYIVINDVHIPKDDIDSAFARKNGFAVAVKTRYDNYVVLKDDKWGIASPDGKLLCEPKYSRIYEFVDGLAWAEQTEEITTVAEYSHYEPNLGRYVDEGEEYQLTFNNIGIITKDGVELVAPYYDRRLDSNHYNVERFGDAQFTYSTVDAEKGIYSFGIYRGKDYFNEFTEKYGYDTAVQCGDLWFVSKNGLKGIVTADNEEVIPLEFAEIMYVPASEMITLDNQTEKYKEMIKDQHFSSPISELDDGSKLVNVKTAEGKIRAYQIRDVEETTTTITTTTTAKPTTTTAVPTTTTTTKPTTTTAKPTTTTAKPTTTTAKPTTTTAKPTTTTAVPTTTTTAKPTTTMAVPTTTTTAKPTTTTEKPTTTTAVPTTTTTAKPTTTTEKPTTTTAVPTTTTTAPATTTTEELTATTTELITTTETPTTVSEPAETEPVTTTEPGTGETLPADIGDVNSDGVVDSSDASEVLMIYAMVSTGGGDLPGEQKAVADINGDGLVDSSDASLILEYYAYVSTGGTDTADVYFSKEQEIT